jgi:hypothetical protein
LSYGPPLVVWQRVPLYLDFRVVAPAVLAAVAIGVSTLLAWPVATILRWRQGRRWSENEVYRRCHIAVRLALALQIAVIAAAAFLFIVATANPTVLNDALDPVLITLYACAWVGVLSGFGTVWIALQFWRKRVGSWWARLHQTLIAASAMTLAWFFLISHLAGTTLNY